MTQPRPPISLAVMLIIYMYTPFGELIFLNIFAKTMSHLTTNNYMYNNKIAYLHY